MPRLIVLLVLLVAGCGVTTPPPAAPAPAAEVKSAQAAPKPARPKSPSAVAAKAPAPKPAATPSAAPLDLKSLEERLKDTSAIGVLTKLSLKNQVDDLLGKFRVYHSGTQPPTLTDLRPSFDLLLMKALSLLQDKDAALARDINASREAIWSVLRDKQKFAQYS